MKTSGTLNVRNVAQMLILKCEMLGQISDGQWENASPNDHWQPWCNAEIKVNPDKVGHDFYARKSNYNFRNSELLQIVGERMFFQVKLGLMIAEAAPEFLDTYMDYHWSFPEGLDDFFSDMKMARTSTDKYWIEKFAALEGMGFTPDVVNEIANWDGYSIKQLKADLSDLKVIFKTQCRI